MGCGSGRLTEIFQDARVEYIGFDSNGAAVCFAQKTYDASLKIAPKFFVKDIVDFPWPFEDKTFDLVFMVAVFHHIPSKELRQDVLGEIRRVLKPGGKLIMTNWNLRSIWAIRKFWPEILRIYFPHKSLDKGDFYAPWKLRSGETVNRFYHSFSLKEIKKEIDKGGLTILENYYTLNDRKTNFVLGDNILTVAQKSPSSPELRRGKEESRMAEEKKNLVIFGIQGAGKGTQAKLLAKEFGIPHISTGDILREEKEKDTDRGKLIRSLIDAGKFAPDEIINQIVKDRLNQNDCQNGAILDGYPRNFEQAKVLDKMWEGGVTKAILINLSDKEAIERAIYRRLCKKCGKIYHLKYSPPKNDGACDDCGEALVWRDDDKEEQIKLRLKTYHEKTEPIIDYYREKGVLAEVDGVGTIEDVRQRIKSAIEK